MLKVVDLFCGTGAFTHVFEKHGASVVFANDIEKTSKEIYELNFENRHFKLADLNDLNAEDLPAHDVLCGGFPCQPFSIAGQQLGFRDKRANVFWKIMEIIKFHQPSMILLENVKNLTSHDDGKTFETIKQNLEEENYHLKYKVLDTSVVTHLPQHRERIYIVGFKDPAMCDEFSMDFDKKEAIPIRSLLQEVVPQKYFYRPTSKIYDMLVENVTQNIEDDVVYQYRRVYVRQNKNKKCPTLTANMGGGGHNVPIIKTEDGIRKLTPKECFNLQGFPENYRLPSNVSDSALYKLAGNAVSVPVVELIVENIIRIHQRSSR